MLALAGPAAAESMEPAVDTPSRHHVPNFPEQPDTNRGAQDEGCRAIFNNHGTSVSVEREAEPANDIRGALFQDACVEHGNHLP
jgi:hypothetical protein